MYDVTNERVYNMKNFIRILTFCSIFAYTFEAIAQNTEKAFLKNGSVLEGYLAEQRPGQSFTVHSVKAEIFASEDTLLNVAQQKVELSALPQQWKEWATANNVETVDNTGSYLTLSTLAFRNSTVKNVFVKERGITVKYIDLNERNYVFPWEMLAMTSKNLRPYNQHSGIVDELIMTDGKHFEGQVTDQTPGEGIKIKLSDEVTVKTFNYSAIEQIISKPLSSKLTLWQQSQLLDEVVLNSGETVRGIITKRIIGKYYVFLLQNDRDRTRRVDASKVTVFRKIKNPEYKSAAERELALGEILINGDAKNAYFFNLETTDSYVLLDANSASMQMNCGDTIVVEANVGNPLAAITIAKAKVKDIETVNAKGKKVLQPKAVVTLFDLLQSKNYGTREVTASGYIRYTLPITESGDYVMQIQGKDGYIVIYVPQNNNKQN